MNYEVHKALIDREIESHLAELIALNDNLADHPEVSGQEVETSRKLVELLRGHGYTVEHPYAGLPTAFRAVYGADCHSHKIAILTEYDALPEIGHACGHCLSGSISILAALALRELQDALDADIHYVGIAADEPERLARLEAPKCSPLAEAGMTEADCLAFCYERGFFWEENGVRLYDILDRVSCWCCKNKNRKELKNIYQFLPQYWERLKGLQAQIPMPMKPYSRKGVPYGNVFDLEKVFEQEIQAENSGSSPKGKRRRHEQSR